MWLRVWREREREEESCVYMCVCVCACIFDCKVDGVVLQLLLTLHSELLVFKAYLHIA